ncbi:hypothetical protein SEA_SHAGRAT_26 [Rhodococcus phage Shagrat]|nr:hypothetical protein SEA_SHAGRAT_26 [Rhodococcus phage Shagrat]
MEVRGVISLQPGTWSVQVAVPQDWEAIYHSFTFPNGDRDLVEISGETIEVVTDDSPELEVIERSFLVRWTNPNADPIRVDYIITSEPIAGGGGGLGGLG